VPSRSPEGRPLQGLFCGHSQDLFQGPSQAPVQGPCKIPAFWPFQGPFTAPRLGDATWFESPGTCPRDLPEGPSERPSFWPVQGTSQRGCSRRDCRKDRPRDRLGNRRLLRPSQRAGPRDVSTGNCPRGPSFWTAQATVLWDRPSLSRGSSKRRRFERPSKGAVSKGRLEALSQGAVSRRRLKGPSHRAVSRGRRLRSRRREQGRVCHSTLWFAIQPSGFSGETAAFERVWSRPLTQEASSQTGFSRHPRGPVGPNGSP